MGNQDGDRSLGKVRQLMERLQGRRSLLIVMQDNPDPDSIASAAALRRIANHLGDVPCSIAYGGKIGRGENRALAEYLGLNFRPIDEVDPSKFDAVALVDTQPLTGNNSLPADRTPDIVLDHHPVRPGTRKAAFTDVRRRYGALSTILVEYLRAAWITPEPPLATALLYAIRTDTQDLGARACQADHEAHAFLLPLVNTRMLSVIQRGNVTGEYFQSLANALHGARMYGNAIVSNLGDLYTADMTGECADLLLRHEHAEWALCGGFHHETMWFSVRTSSRDLHAGDLMRTMMAQIGTGGGHPNSAGGQVPAAGMARSRRQAVMRTVRQRFLKAIGCHETRGRKLVHS